MASKPVHQWVEEAPWPEEIKQAFWDGIEPEKLEAYRLLMPCDLVTAIDCTRKEDKRKEFKDLLEKNNLSY